mmetsp:Transcript_10341/g.9967  ORF Transcript_10341/g.9967 Transcript_10341/m.9967 type:complete len:201 (+) Transcript_10341:18-620(+)
MDSSTYINQILYIFQPHFSDFHVDISRAMKKAIIVEVHTNYTTPTSIGISKNAVPIISERRPKTHRVIAVRKVFEYKESGNKAFLSNSFQEAERLYSEALGSTNGSVDDSVSEVYLWQLYSNRNAARIKLDMLSEALRDSLTANICAPLDVVKICAEVIAVLGMQKEALSLLSDSETKFPYENNLIEKKKDLISQRKISS